MPELIRNGRVYVAQPPLFRVKWKSREIYYINEKDMKRDLLNLGLEGVALKVAGTKEPISHKPLRELMDLLVAIEEQAVAIQRWGMTLEEYLALEKGEKLPEFKVMIGVDEKFCYNEEELNEFLKAEQERQGKEVMIADVEKANGKGKETPGEAPAEEPEEERGLEVLEMHAARELERVGKKLKTRGFSLADCVPVKEGKKAKAPKYVLVADDREMPAETLMEALRLVRQAGQKGMDIQRYKGLGEMNAEQLWETTMDPAKRTLLRIKLDDAAEADRMFTILMGENVEPRREFIEKHALEVRFLDI
jgi:DNA gyrase subunit B